MKKWWRDGEVVNNLNEKDIKFDQQVSRKNKKYLMKKKHTKYGKFLNFQKSIKNHK